MPDKSPKILIVDDDVDILANLSDILSDLGFQTATAPNGRLALQEIDTECSQDDCRFDLCLLDFKMPDMDGVELLEKIQAMHPNIRAIMITAHAGEDGYQRAVAAGTWKVMKKPVDISMLLGMIEEAVA